MNVELADVANAIQNKIGAISFLEKWHQSFPINNKFYYDYYNVYNNIITIDVKSFNMIFLKYINLHMQEPIINEFIKYVQALPKNKRVVLFGLLFREVGNRGILLNPYMIAVRNICLCHFLRLYKESQRNVKLHRINYDDIEFDILNSSSFNTESFVHERFLPHVTFNVIDHIIVLNKKDGVYYISGNKILDIKYTSGWVNIPIYKTLLTEILRFVIQPNMTMKELHFKLNEIIEYTGNDQFFGYEDCRISKQYKPDDSVPFSVKNLFIANTMSKFTMLFNRM
mgnify:CR=1 FL=1